MQVPFLSLKDITAKYADELHGAVLRVTDSGWYLQGNENSGIMILPKFGKEKTPCVIISS